MKISDIMFKVLTILVIPILLWGIKIESDRKLNTEKLSRIERNLEKLETKHLDLKKDQKVVEKNVGRIYQIEKSLEKLERTYSDLKSDQKVIDNKVNETNVLLATISTSLQHIINEIKDIKRELNK